MTYDMFTVWISRYLRAESRFFMEISLSKRAILARGDDARALDAHTARPPDDAARHVDVVRPV